MLGPPFYSLILTAFTIVIRTLKAEIRKIYGDKPVAWLVLRVAARNAPIVCIVPPSRSETPFRVKMVRSEKVSEAGGRRGFLARQGRRKSHAEGVEVHEGAEAGDSSGFDFGKLSQAEECRKHRISSTYPYKPKDRALELLRQRLW